MVIKVDKSEEFKKSGKKLISEYDGDKWLEKIEKNVKKQSGVYNFTREESIKTGEG